MSPERLEGKDYGYSADIWALGVTLYECATGSNPFLPKKVDFIEMFENVVRGKLPDCSAFSADFQSFIASCLQKDPTQRPTASELLKHPFITRNQSFYKKEMSAWLKDKLKLKPPASAASGAGAAIQSPAPGTNTSGGPPTAVAAPAKGGGGGGIAGMLGKKNK